MSPRNAPLGAHVYPNAYSYSSGYDVCVVEFRVLIVYPNGLDIPDAQGTSITRLSSCGYTKLEDTSEL